MNNQKITSETVKVNGLRVKIWVVRDSAQAKQNNKDFVVIGNEIHVADARLHHLVLIQAMKTFENRSRLRQLIINFLNDYL